MKSVKTSVYSFLLVLLPLFMISCSKDGDTGPAGATGPAGPAGPAGVAGPAGAPGSANVIYSPWTDVTFAPDTIRDENGAVLFIGFFADLNVPKLTAAILTSGDVRTYVNSETAAAPQIFPLPYYDAVFSGLSIDVSYSSQTISLYSNSNVSTRLNAQNAKVLQYRYVIIPGGTPARVMPNGKAVDWNNYKSVQEYLGLTD